MQTEQLRKIADKYLRNIKVFKGKNVLRGEYFYEDKLISTFFVDYSSQPLNGIDLEQYQEELISTPYYGSNEFLQWNFYLFFLRDKIDQIQKKRIEEDITFTRKYVFYPNEFETYFKFQSVKHKIKPDITLEWKEKLRKADLDEVYSQATFKDAIDRFIENEVQKDHINETKEKLSKTKDILKIDKIKQLEIGNNFRSYPEKRKFVFKTVNLITGVNGTGKTSLLEAIELLLCGHGFRNQDDYEKDAELIGHYEGFPIADKFDFSDQVKYKKRDEAWYKTPDMKWRSNSTAIGFNRFNFYNSEAAYRLASGNDAENFTKQMITMALGTEFNYLKERLVGFNERLNNEMRNYKKDVENARKLLDEAKGTIKQLEKTNDFAQKRFHLFKDQANQIEWKKSLPEKYDEEFSVCEKAINEIENYVEELVKLFEDLEENNFKEIKQKHEKLMKLLETLKTGEISLSKFIKSDEMKQKEFKSLDDSLKVLEQAKKYFENKDSFSLLGTGDKKQKLENELHVGEKVHKLLENLPLEHLKDQRATFLQFKKEIDNSYIELKKKQEGLDAKVAIQKRNLNRLQNILSEIKAKGREYLDIKPDSEKCPLCGEDYEKDELKKRILDFSENTQGLSELDGLLSKAKETDILINAVSEKRTHFEKFEELCILVYEDDIYRGMGLDKIIDKILYIDRQINIKREDLQRLIMLKNKLEQAKCFEEELKKLQLEIDLHFAGTFQMKLEDEAIFNNIYDATLKNRILIKEDLKNIAEKVEHIKGSAENAIRDYDDRVPLRSYQSYLVKEKNKLEMILERFSLIEGYIAIKDIEKVDSVYLKIKKFVETFQTFIKELREENNRGLLLTKCRLTIKEAKKELDEKSPILNRINLAVGTIKAILSSTENNRFLESFIQDNAKEIGFIFGKIHSPREFNEIIFEKSEIKLKRIDSNKKHTLSRISSGQRSALALAIFLSLNRKLEKGPNLIIFDDPVVFTDDLNILTFLDYLRELVINEDRQVFFSTANQKLASLFRKKFSFLGEEFSEEPLTRSSVA
jgi:DNA repair exonuclease SbcCD ATPase subunit